MIIIDSALHHTKPKVAYQNGEVGDVPRPLAVSVSLQSSNS